MSGPPFPAPTKTCPDPDTAVPVPDARRTWALGVAAASFEAMSNGSSTSASTGLTESPMSKTILITGATDGIGLCTARRLAAGGHTVLLHGRSEPKLERAQTEVAGVSGGAVPPIYRADLTDLGAIDALAAAVAEDHPHLDVLINNAGVYKTARARTADGLDVRFAVNTLAPVRLTTGLLPLMAEGGRILNLSSAAQSPPDLEALAGHRQLDGFAAYAQSKLALTMWSAWLADELRAGGLSVISVNPGSLLDTKMVREGFGRSRGSAEQGAEILERLAVTELGAEASGLYFDNDAGAFSAPHPAASDASARAAVVRAIQDTLARLGRRVQGTD